jgi:RIO-like serine/threonine protein kinase
MEGSQGTRILKRDVFGTVERQGDALVRRVASGSRAPLSRVLAGRLLERERRALERLAGLDGVPQLVRTETSSAGHVLVRTFVAGEPLSSAVTLPENFFDELDALVAALHARGVCHNDLHKEQNVIVAADGYPWLVDFQLASVHPNAGWIHARRAREDLRHVEKHRRRYTRDGRGPQGVRTFGRGAGSRRSPLAFVWRRLGKPVYNLAAGLVAPERESEIRRPSSGPWPAWIAPVTPRDPAAGQRMSSR